MKHLDWAELLAYGDPSLKKREREPLLNHMQSCSACRDRYISVQSFRSALKKAPPPFIPFELTRECIPEEFLGDFMGGRLPSSDQTAYSKHTADCDICFERAAYLAWSGAKMTEGVLTMDPTPDRYKSAVLKRPVVKSGEAIEPFSIWNLVRRWIGSPLPAYAFAASLLFFLFIGTFKAEENLIYLKGDQTFSLYEEPAHGGSSFGFSDAGRKINEIAAGLAVSRQDDGGLRFSWNRVEGANDYSFHLAELNTAGAKNLFDTKTDQTEVYTSPSLLSPGSVYRWKVTGSTETGEIFVAQGQFALPS